MKEESSAFASLLLLTLASSSTPLLWWLVHALILEEPSVKFLTRTEDQQLSKSLPGLQYPTGTAETPSLKNGAAIEFFTSPSDPDHNV